MLSCLKSEPFSSGVGVRDEFLGLDVRRVFDSGTGGQTVGFDDAGETRLFLHAKGVAHRAGHGLHLLRILIGEGDQHDEEADQQAHEVGKGDKPAVTAAVCFLAPPHPRSSTRQLGSI